MLNRILFVMLLFSGSLTAADWAAWKLSGERQLNREGRLMYQLKDQSGNTFSLMSDVEVTDKVVRMAAETAKVLFGWNSLQIRVLKLYYIKGKFRAIVLPSSFMCGKEDVAPFMPAGMVFFFKDKLSYDFRMIKDNISMKIRGIFSTRPEFAATIINAVKNPLAYASRSNHMARIDELNRKLSALTYRHYQLQKRFDLAVNALLFFRNTGFLRGPRKIKSAVIQRVVQLKKNKPNLNVDQISNILEKEKIKASSKEIHLILAVFFNYYKK